MNALRSSLRTRAGVALLSAALVLGGVAGVPGTWGKEDRGGHDHAAHGHAHGHDIERAELPSSGEVKARRLEAVVNDAPEPLIAEAAELPIDPIHMKVLVLAATGTEPELGAITTQLDYLGTPYEVMAMAPVPAAGTDRLAAKLSDLPLETAINAWYQAVILTDATLTYKASDGRYLSALSAAEWASLRAFQAKWRIREVAWNAWPTPDQGFGPVSGSTCTGNEQGTNTWCSLPPIRATFGAGAAEVFGTYANLGASIPITNTWVNLATPLADGDSAPLLVDARGHALAVRRDHRAADGNVARESITMTFGNNEHELSSAVLGYGLVNWVTKGMFLGERKVYLGAQIDDVFLSGAVWEVGTPCGTKFDYLREYRNTAQDWNAFVQWQRDKRARTMTADLRVAMAYNGLGADPTWYRDDYLGGGNAIDAEATDTLVPAARATQDEFEWISHTWSHRNMDWLEYPKPPPGTEFTVTEEHVLDELERNHDLAGSLGLTRYTRETLVQPEVSGLRNPEAMRALVTHGVRYVVGDTSRLNDEMNPSPNAANPNPLEPSVLMIPRRPNNLYYNVSTPDEWLAEDNCMYPANVHGHVDSYDELLDREASVLARYMLRGDMDPWMFHANNIRDYGDGRSLLSDLLDRTLDIYDDYFTLPVETLTMDEIGREMARRSMFKASGASGRFVPEPPDSHPGAITIATVNQAVVPVTGLLGANGQTYGGQLQSWVALGAGGEQVFNDGSTPPPDAGGTTPTPMPTTTTTTTAPPPTTTTTTTAPPPPVKAASVDPGTMTFAGRAPGTGQSEWQVARVANTGTAPVAISGVGLIGANAADFVLANACPSTLAVGAACEVSVAFRPTAAGTRLATLNVATDAGTKSVELSGVGLEASASVSATSLAFGDVRRHQTSAPRTVTVRNTGNAAMTVAVSLAGKHPGQFDVASSCPASLAGGGSCTITVQFAPTNKGTKTANLRIATNAPQGTLTVALSGTGV